MDATEERRQKLTSTLATLGLDALIVHRPTNMRYLSGFTGDAGVLLVTSETAQLITDSRFVLRAAEELKGVKVVEQGDSLEATLAEVAPALEGQHWGFEAEQVTYANYERLRQALTAITLVSTENLLLAQRAVKDTAEIALISHACAMADQTLEEAFVRVHPGVRECDLSLWLEMRMRELGAEKVAFSGVASGPRGALPHGGLSERVIEAGDLVRFDIGCRYRGYHSDVTRTIGVQSVDDELRRVYDLVLQAQETALAAVRPGVRACDVDRAARQVIEAEGYGPYFGHGTGHGVGLEVHELPTISARNEQVLSTGMVFTVEPGVYLPGRGGVRIEDTVLVTEAGGQVLTPISKEFFTVT